MSALPVLVDYDNLDRDISRAGPIRCAERICRSIPVRVFNYFDQIAVRLYGGWRSGGVLTRSAQLLVPEINAYSSGYIVMPGSNPPKKIRLTVEMAYGPLGVNRALQETYVKDRGLRGFRARHVPWNGCASPATCGLSNLYNTNHHTSCGTGGCEVRLADVFVRDEQKMVDTLMVADIAYHSFVSKSKIIAVVSSDIDMWPGVLLALQVGREVIHVHTKTGWRTQRHLVGTLDGKLSKLYQQVSV